MQWLNDWIREIVFIILLAAFLDLILPNSSLERYVKVVVSLIILLVILSPIISFLQADWQMDHLFDAQAQYEHAPAMRDLNSVLAEGEELRRYQESQSVQLVKQQMEHMVRDLIEQKYPGIIYQMNISFIEKKDEPPQFDHLRLVLDASKLTDRTDAASNEGSSGEWMEAVRPIEPIRIQIQRDDDQDDSKEEQFFSEAQQARHHEVRTDIIQILQAHYPWMNGSMTVTFHGKEANLRSERG